VAGGSQLVTTKKRTAVGGPRQLSDAASPRQANDVTWGSCASRAAFNSSGRASAPPFRKPFPALPRLLRPTHLSPAHRIAASKMADEAIKRAMDPNRLVKRCCCHCRRCCCCRRHRRCCCFCCCCCCFCCCFCCCCGVSGTACAVYRWRGCCTERTPIPQPSYATRSLTNQPTPANSHSPAWGAQRSRTTFDSGWGPPGPAKP